MSDRRNSHISTHFARAGNRGSYRECLLRRTGFLCARGGENDRLIGFPRFLALIHANRSLCTPVFGAFPVAQVDALKSLNLIRGAGEIACREQHITPRKKI